MPSVRRQLWRARGALLGGANLFQHRREIERYSGSRARRAVDCQPAAMLADQTVDYAEAEPGAALFAGEAAIHLAKWKQGHRSRLAADADALVGDAQPGGVLARGGNRHPDLGAGI